MGGGYNGGDAATLQLLAVSFWLCIMSVSRCRVSKPYDTPVCVSENIYTIFL